MCWCLLHFELPSFSSQILKKYTMDVRKEVSLGQPVTFSAKAGAVSLLLNNQDQVTVSPELTRKGSFVLVISKEKINGEGGGRIIYSSLWL